jgi:hypothetical protein
MTEVRNQASVEESSALSGSGPDKRRGHRMGVGGSASRLLDLNAAAYYLGLSYWTMRDLVQSGQVPTVRLPSPRARDGRAIRRTLVDREDLDRLVEHWKASNVQ